MYLNDMAEMLRVGGMRVVELADSRINNHGSLKAAKSIVCHHTAGSLNGNAPSLYTVSKGRPGLDGPLGNILLARDGTVYVVSTGTAWHAGTTINDSLYANYNSIGIEAENTGVGEVWPLVQVNAYAKLCALLCRHYKIPLAYVRGHKEICSPPGRKIDPANLPGDMNGLRVRINEFLNEAVSPIPKEAEMGSHPVSLKRTNEWEVMNFPVETGTAVVKDMWFTISSSFGATEYMLILEDGRGFLDQQSGTQGIGDWGKEVTAGSGTRQFHLLPRGITSLSLRYRNIGGAVAGISFPQT